MTATRSLLLVCLVWITGCGSEGVEQADPAQPVPTDATCGCPFLSTQPAYKINTSPDSLTQYYLGVWQREFIKRNRIDDATFRAKILLVTGTLFSWNEGISFRVDYTYRQDWLSVPAYEQFRVNYDPVKTAGYIVDVPRGVNLKEGQIIFREPWAENTEPINLNATLAFSSCERACDALRTSSKFQTLTPHRVSFYVPGNIPRIPGDPHLFSIGTIDSLANRCVQGQINLVTGAVKASETPCLIR